MRAFAWYVFGLCCLVCLAWIGGEVRDGMREAGVFDEVVAARVASAEAGADKVVLGVAGTWSRHAALLKGIRLGVQAVNGRGGLLGRTVELDVRDDHGTEEGALAVAQEFATTPQIPFVLGHTDARLNRIVGQNYALYGVLLFSPGVAAQGSGKESHLLHFCNGLSPRLLGRALLQLAVGKGWRRLGLIYGSEDDLHGQARLIESLASVHGLAVPLTLQSGADTDWAGQMAHWKREQALDAVIVVVSDARIGGVVHRLRDAGIRAPIVLAAEPPRGLEESAFNGPLYFLQPPLMRNGNGEQDSWNSFDEAYGYESVLLLAQAVREASSLVPAKVADALRVMRVAHPVADTTGFDSNGMAVKSFPAVRRVRGGATGNATDEGPGR